MRSVSDSLEIQAIQSYLQVIKLFFIAAPDRIVHTVIIGDESDSLVRVVLVAVTGPVVVVAGVAVDALRDSESPVLDRDMLGLIVGFAGFYRSGDCFAVEAFPGRLGDGKECRGEVCVAGHDVQSLALWDTGAANDERDVDIGIYSILSTRA